ncbi:hypothetical protein ATG98_0957 [Marinobacter sp. LV10R520-4]|uniref:SMEK domain-containing protein n=1 Tax=Marinobacter sp. LV10R520-4 TaxID=1761796 RepID=UPI000BF724F2|nr:SMEK domain-containing protein [Marinobacter sp. LV10R520-4]PFG51974.1 hypothetical protein ATG98_0957 [Marinobacter sp. LV10R520-4]
MLQNRKFVFDQISYILAITRLDIEQHQAISDYSLNVHSENYWRDIFNFIHNSCYENANFETSNTPCIDLIDNKKKILIQITTTKTKEKIDNTLKALLTNSYKDYKIKIYYLLDKAHPNEKSQRQVLDQYGVTLSDILFDSHDIISDVNNLTTARMIELYQQHFEPNQEKYTDIKVLDLAIHDLVKNHTSIKPNFNTSYGSVEVNKKIIINNLNERLSSKIKDNLDYACLVDEIADGLILHDLREFIIGDLYKKVLLRALRYNIEQSDKKILAIEDLNFLAMEKSLDFNEIILSLFHSIESKLLIKDFNSTNVGWILVSYFFEYCDTGVKNAFPNQSN